MSALFPTNHAALRFAQRSVRPADIELILRAGSWINGDTVCLTDRDADDKIESIKFELGRTRCPSRLQELKRQLQRLSHLRRAELVLIDDRIVTSVRPGKKRLKRQMRRSQW